MALSKFGIACIAAVLAGGATAGLAGDYGSPAVPAQVSEQSRATPISAIADPERAFKDVAVQFVSGKALGHVVAVSTDGAGRAARVRVALDDMPAQQIWLDQDDLVYSRARDVIVAHDVHAPTMAVADAR
ncbi:MAG TPA: hypothetical protein VNU97_03615 [Rhizomicrobium sp.]|jgi:hypothetical protein|nr:hypothetical protein [Rhizomicrobium sp.]